uniref:Uncharacterized protein n=1 Tax=uncultured nuHF2 cluster bacterium HF0770_42C12 TaxID=723593 RepID=E7C817_9BACT|nr:hypothetical protein [uncultured nuHF2 cluster bacterium HF0770_42C12]
MWTQIIGLVLGLAVIGGGLAVYATSL